MPYEGIGVLCWRRQQEFRPGSTFQALHYFDYGPVNNLFNMHENTKLPEKTNSQSYSSCQVRTEPTEKASHYSLLLNLLCDAMSRLTHSHKSNQEKEKN